MLRPILIFTYELACSSEVAKTVRKNINAEYEMKFVKEISDSFEIIRSNVLATTPLPNINLVLHMAINMRSSNHVDFHHHMLCMFKEMPLQKAKV